jgi:hypothetical protein
MISIKIKKPYPEWNRVFPNYPVSSAGIIRIRFRGLSRYRKLSGSNLPQGCLNI